MYYERVKLFYTFDVKNIANVFRGLTLFIIFKSNTCLIVSTYCHQIFQMVLVTFGACPLNIIKFFSFLYIYMYIACVIQVLDAALECFIVILIDIGATEWTWRTQLRFTFECRSGHGSSRRLWGKTIGPPRSVITDDTNDQDDSGNDDTPRVGART